VVVVRTDDDVVVCMKAEREGADYVHHYLVPVDPEFSEEARLIYVDPDDELVHWDGRIHIALADDGQAAAPDVGHVFTNAAGTFLKVIDDPKSQKMFAFVDIATGEIRRRQERGVTVVHTAWRAEARNDAGAVPLSSLREAFLRLD
jgi:hypothetical protein